jgi:hypothetical protein
MPDGVTLPWVVTLHELEQVCDLIDWPVQLIHFLRRRSRLNQLGGLTASDELDRRMHYPMYAWYFKDRDPSIRQREPVAARRARERGAAPLDEPRHANPRVPGPHLRRAPERMGARRLHVPRRT